MKEVRLTREEIDAYWDMIQAALMILKGELHFRRRSLSHAHKHDMKVKGNE